MRLKGAIYERLLTLAKDLEQQSKAQKQSTGEMLKVALASTSSLSKRN
ncbi:MbeB family mobilization protein [Shigella flexneri]